MAVSHVAPALTTALQDYGFLGKLEKDGTIGFNLPGLNDHQVSQLDAFRKAQGLQVALKRSGTGLRITLSERPVEAAQKYFHIGARKLGDDKFKVMVANSPKGFNITRLDDLDFSRLLAFREEAKLVLTLKRSGTGIRVTLASR